MELLCLTVLVFHLNSFVEYQEEINVTRDATVRMVYILSRIYLHLSSQLTQFTSLNDNQAVVEFLSSQRANLHLNAFSLHSV